MTTIAAALRDLLDPTMQLDVAVDRHFAPDYRQRTDGLWSERSEFIEHIDHLRSAVRLDGITVLEELVNGPAYAERHVVRLAKLTGGRVEQEVYVFGERANDGRFTRIEESTLMVHGDDADRNIASAH